MAVPAQCGVEESNVNKRTAVVVAVVAVLLVVPLAGSASAHEEHKVDRYTVEVGFGAEPRRMPLEPYFGTDLGTPGDYRAVLIPTTQGAGPLGLLAAVGVGALALRRRS
jgi:MYXO-CTERM domain-containing protein